MLNLGTRAAQLWFILKPTTHTTDINPCLVQLQVYRQYSRNLDLAEGPGITVGGLPCIPAKKALNHLVCPVSALSLQFHQSEKSDDHPFPLLWLFHT